MINDLYQQPVPGFENTREWNESTSFEYCKWITLNHYENFPVGSKLLPRELRQYVYSIYAFARTADDFADEAFHEGMRMQRLEAWRKALHSCSSPENAVHHPVFIAVARTMQKFDIPMQLFDDLLTAFMMDVTVKRHDDFASVLHYCKHSANPVGRLILYLFGYRNKKLHELSDHICTALQLANFWQDVAVDLRKDRIYLPLEEIEHFGYSVEELKHRRFNDKFRNLMHYQVERAQTLFDKGLPLCFMVNRDLRMELKCTWLGGTTILRMIKAQDYNVLVKRPALSKMRKLMLLSKAFVWSRPRQLETQV